MINRFKSLRYTALSLVGVLVLALCTSCADEVHEYLIEGYFYEDASETPMKNATLSFVMSTSEKEIGTAKTDRRGRFAFRFQNEGYFKTTETYYEDSDYYDDDVDVDIYYQNELIYTFNTNTDNGKILKLYSEGSGNTNDEGEDNNDDDDENNGRNPR